MNTMTIYNSGYSKFLADLQKNTEDGFGYFYIVEFSENFVKIGCTRYPASRICQISYTIAKGAGLSIKRIAVSGQCKYFQQYEKIMHNAFKKERIQGSELFKVSFDTAFKVGVFLIKTVNEETQGKKQAFRKTLKTKLISSLKARKLTEILGIAFMAGIEAARQLEELEV